MMDRWVTGLLQHWRSTGRVVPAFKAGDGADTGNDVPPTVLDLSSTLGAFGDKRWFAGPKSPNTSWWMTHTKNLFSNNIIENWSMSIGEPLKDGDVPIVPELEMIDSPGRRPNWSPYQAL